jgi:parvulin-like peptidyl-prolyl isomerase
MKRSAALLTTVAVLSALAAGALAEPKKPVAAPAKPAAKAAEPAAPADPAAEAARRAEVVATFEGGTVTVGELEDQIAAQSPFMRERYSNEGERRALLDKSVRFELLALEAEKRGYGKNDAVAYSVKQNAVQAMLKKEVDDKVSAESIPAADVKAYYDAHLDEFVRPELRRASAVLVASETEAKALMPQARSADLRAFRELARTKSIDEENKLRGGDLRYFDNKGKVAEETAANVDPAIVKIAFSLKTTGDTAEPVKTERGWAIVKLTGQREAHEEKLADADERIRMRLWRERRQASIDALLGGLRAQYKPEVHPELVDAIKFDNNAPVPTAAGLPPGFPRPRPEK